MLRLAVVVALSFAPPMRPVATPHTDLKRSEPSKGSTLATSPKRISLWFTAKPQLAFTRITLKGPRGDIPLDTVVADTGFSLHAQVPATLVPGAYVIRWQTASADGHAIRGEIPFSIAGSTVDTAVRPPPTVPVEAHEHPAVPPAAESAPQIASEYRSARWFEFAAMLTILGALGFRHAVLPPLAVRGVVTSDAADRARRLGRIALVIYLVAAIVRLVAETIAMHGKDGLLGSMMPMLAQTTWGIGWILGAVGALLLFVAWWLPRRAAHVVGTPLALTGALGIVLAPALSGHAAASRYFILSVTLDALHVAAAGLWIGGLLIVVLVGIPAMRRLEGNPDGAVKALFSSFHPLALLCAPIVVVAGMATSWLRLGSVVGIRTFYGSALLVKLGLFLAVAGMGAYNAFRVRRTLGTPDGTARLRRTASIELTIAALVLVATTFLVVSPVPIDIAP
jgi:copper transport protein